MCMEGWLNCYAQSLCCDLEHIQNALFKLLWTSVQLT